MKKIILVFVVLVLLISCSKKEQYYGTWSQFHYSSALIKIKSDSISLSDDGSIWKTYPLKIENNSLSFLDHTFQTTIYKDSLIFEKLAYKKDTITPILEIKLPKLDKFSFQEPNPEEELIYIQYGRVPNSNEYKLQLNDKYADFEELIPFFFNHYNSEISLHALRRFALLCDKRAKMKDIELLFHELIKINALVLYTVNDIKYEVIDNEIEQLHSLYKHKIIPIYNVNYETKLNMDADIDHNMLNYSILEHLKTENLQYVFLINNEFYVGKEKYSLGDFSKRIDTIIAKKVQLVSLFDLNSDFKHYTIFNALINDSYQKLYDSIAKQKYNITYSKLNDKEKEEILDLFPRKDIQNISIPHFLSFEETPIEGINFPFKNVKEEIPEVYFEQVK